MYLYTHRRPVDLNYYEYYYFAMLTKRASTELFPASNPCQHDHWTKSHAMLTPAIAQRSANLGVTIIKKKNVCHPVPRCPNDRGLFVICRPVLSVFVPPICYRFGPFDGKSSSASIRVSSPRAKQRIVGQQPCTVFAFLFAGQIFFSPVTAV